MKYFPVIILFFGTFSFFSQEKFSKEISFINDNDLYISKVRDRYYTDGLFLSYRYLSNNKKDNLEKEILEWQIGHEMYTPYRAAVENINQHDRPFAGYLYASFDINRIYKNNQNLSTSIQIGVLGPASYAEELQDLIHNIYGFKKAVGWEHQIKNAFALNINAKYIKHLVKSNSNYFDISWVNAGKIGTIYNTISSGFYGRIGFKPLQKLANSIAFNTSINNTNTNYVREVESFIYIKPMLRYAFYDATIQGSFLNKNSAVTKALIPLVFDIELGLRFTANRFNFGYSFHYNTNKSKGLRYNNGNKYGTIIVNYLLR